MKAIDILKQIITFGYLPDCGTFDYDRENGEGESSFLRNYFGATDHTPKEKLKDGTWFYLYAEDPAEIFPDNTPDIKINKNRP